MHLGYGWKSQKEEKDVDAWIILRWTFDGVELTGSFWLRIGTSGGLL
jgi:hypothetical protein